RRGRRSPLQRGSVTAFAGGAAGVAKARDGAIGSAKATPTQVTGYSVRRWGPRRGQPVRYEKSGHVREVRVLPERAMQLGRCAGVHASQTPLMTSIAFCSPFAVSRNLRPS